MYSKPLDSRRKREDELAVAVKYLALAWTEVDETVAEFSAIVPIAPCGHIKSDKAHQQWEPDVLGLLQATLQ